MKATKKITILLIILDILTVIFLFFTYGPIDYFRNLLITTAMTTKSHHYLALTLYDEKTVYEVSEEDIEKQLNQMADRNSRMVTVEDRAAELGDSSSVQVGEFAMAVGNPLGLQSSISCGCFIRFMHCFCVLHKQSRKRRTRVVYLYR